LPPAESPTAPGSLDAAALDRFFASASDEALPLSAGSHQSPRREVVGNADVDALAGYSWFLIALNAE
jgi:hypothetical protein